MSGRCGAPPSTIIHKNLLSGTVRGGEVLMVAPFFWWALTTFNVDPDVAPPTPLH